MSDWWIVMYYKVPAEDKNNAVMRFYAAKHNHQEMNYFWRMKIVPTKKKKGWRDTVVVWIHEWIWGFWRQVRGK